MEKTASQSPGRDGRFAAVAGRTPPKSQPAAAAGSAGPWIGGALTTALLDLLLFLGAVGVGWPWYDAHLASLTAAVGLTLAAGWLWHAFRRQPPAGPRHGALHAAVFLCVLFLRGGLLATLIETLSLPLPVAAGGAAVFSAAALWVGQRVWAGGAATAAGSIAGRHWRIGSILLFVVLLRLFYSAPFELLHEEAYYWLYARFLDIGYLDHPPMVGWLIWLFTAIFGQSEFAVRFGAFACWVVTAAYTARLSRAIGGDRAGLTALVLAALLPAYFATGMLMTPDAPLIACWAAALFYLYRALVDERPGAWLGVGISMGLGLLSKYTIVLLGGAAWLYLVLTPTGRAWLKKPHPWLAALLALALFSPVIAWNAAHDWVSFYFQAVGRHRGGINFGLLDLVGSSLVLLTPAGLLSLAALAWRRKKVMAGMPDGIRRGLRLMAWLSLPPLLVFFAFSLVRPSKLNWTAPIWLGALPFLALFTCPLGGGNGERAGSRRCYFPRLWPASSAALLVLYGAVLHYLAIGLPGIPYPWNTLDIGKRSLVRQVRAARDDLARKTGQTPLVVCWDAEQMPSWVAYYLAREDAARGAGMDEAVHNTTGAQIFDEDTKMFRYWQPVDTAGRRPLLVVVRKRWQLEWRPTVERATPLGAVTIADTRQNGKPTGRYFYRAFIENPPDRRPVHPQTGGDAPGAGVE